jgi:MFS family permease
LQRGHQREERASCILGASISAFVFGRIAEVIGRKKVYATVAVIMIIWVRSKMPESPRYPAQVLTTFVLPSEVFPVSMRTTGHGIAAGIGKLGAFVGVFLVPVLQDHIGLRGLLAVAGVSAVLGFAVTGLLPEPAGRTLEDVADQRSDVAAPAPVRVVTTDDLTNRELETA